MLFISHKVCLIIRFMNIWLNKIDHVLQNQYSVGIYIAINLPKIIRIRRLKIILNLTFKIIALNRSFLLLFQILLFFILIDSYLGMTSSLDWNLAVMPIDCFAILTVFLSRLLFLTLARLLCPGNDVITTLILLLVSMTAQHVSTDSAWWNWFILSPLSTPHLTLSEGEQEIHVHDS